GRIHHRCDRRQLPGRGSRVRDTDPRRLLGAVVRSLPRDRPAARGDRRGARRRPDRQGQRRREPAHRRPIPDPLDPVADPVPERRGDQAPAPDALQEPARGAARARARRV
ncbi:MAG: Thioredoxin, partial [uncultured Solirubrobacteraceae bacterium]